MSLLENAEDAEASDLQLAELEEWKARAEKAERERDVLRAMGEKVNEIRKSIIGAQTFNWSEHAYPLVAALDAAGFDGGEYEDNHKNVGTLIEQIKVADRALAESQAQERELRKAVIEYRDALAPVATAVGIQRRIDAVNRLNAALSAPQDDSALREFGLKVAREATEDCSWDCGGLGSPSVIVDAVLNDGHPLADALETNGGPIGKEPKSDPKLERP